MEKETVTISLERYELMQKEIVELKRRVYEKPTEEVPPKWYDVLSLIFGIIIAIAFCVLATFGLGI